MCVTIHFIVCLFCKMKFYKTEINGNGKFLLLFWHIAYLSLQHNNGSNNLSAAK